MEHHALTKLERVRVASSQEDASSQSDHKHLLDLGLPLRERSAGEQRSHDDATPQPRGQTRQGQRSSVLITPDAIKG